jgi:hypothetical protein
MNTFWKNGSGIAWLISGILFSLYGKGVLGKYNHPYSSYFEFGNNTNLIGFLVFLFSAICFFVAYLKFKKRGYSK